MDAVTTAIIFSLATVLVNTLDNTYFYLPHQELKRQSQQDRKLKKLLKVTKYEIRARILLRFLKFIFGGIVVIVIARSVSGFAALSLFALLLLTLKISGSGRNRFSINLAATSAPFLAKTLHYIEPITKTVANFLPTDQSVTTATIYDVEDLKEVIENQKKSADNRISLEDLNGVLSGLDFRTQKIKDHMVAKNDIRFVNAKEPIGPILISELHKSGFSCFPVQGNSQNEALGVIDIDELSKHAEGGVVSEAMNSEVVYVNESKDLKEVLRAFIQTGRRMFIVINSKNKITGLITVDDMLEQLIGHKIETGLEDYADSEAVSKG